MEEIESIFGTLFIIYLVECISSVEQNTVVIYLPWRSVCRIKYPFSFYGRSEKGVIFLNPFPPMSVSLVSYQWPFSVSPTAVYSYSSRNIQNRERVKREGAFIRFDDIEEVKRLSTQVIVNNKIFLDTTTNESADFTVEFIRTLKPLSVKERSEFIENTLMQQMDDERISLRIQEFKELSTSLIMMENFLFVYLFIYAPILVWWRGIKITWLPLLLLLIAITAMAIFEYYRLYRALFPQVSKKRIFKDLIKAVYFPALMRAHDKLSRAFIHLSHPLPIAKALCLEKEFLDFTKKMVLDMHYPLLPICPTEDLKKIETEKWFRSKLIYVTKMALQKWNVDIDSLMAPPKIENESCRSYCPRCNCQYMIEKGVCIDCGGISLHRL
jgi:hypothetical protein